MLRIVRSNAIEALLDQLARRLADAPLCSPITPEVVVAPSPAMARWINLQLARRYGVAANVQYPLPATFVWRIASETFDDLPDADPLDREVMAWKLFALLPEMLRQPVFEPLRHYLAQDDAGLKRWQLATRIGDVFDRYQFYRPELIRAWGEGPGADWQAQLWCRVTQGIERQHRVAVIDRLLESLHRPESQFDLPDRISVFAVSSLPPLFVEVIHAVTDRAHVDLYLHAPTDAFWADLISQKELARKRLQKPEEAELWEVGNSLLASWGRQGQALQDLLLARETLMEEIDAFIEPSARTLLQHLQQDIFRLRPFAADGERPAVVPDDSVQVHICHSALRECQILHDRLLDILESDSDLRPEDILVMVPEISSYAPYIEAVFERDDERHRPFIPWNLSDISAKDQHPLVQVVLQLLGLSDSRFSQSEILSYLDVPELAGHFRLDSEAVARIKSWLAQANLRWGLDGKHKARLGLPATEENTWVQVERRLFAGYAMGEGVPFSGISPIGSVEGKQAEVLGNFWQLFSTLTESAGRLATARYVEDWRTCICELLADFFGERDDEDGQIQKIRDAVSELSEQAGDLDELLSPALMRNWLAHRLGAEGRRGRYFSGGVTFCGMRPMRSLPFQVICVLGLQDQVFPRRERPADFDLMRKSWRPGDPRHGDEDRYLFLETLLCARRRLYLSYVGRDIRNNTERQPSVLVRELLDYIDQQYRIASDETELTLVEALTRVHPLQPFSPRNYAGGQLSHDSYWCQVAKAMQQPDGVPGGEPVHWPETRLPDAPDPMREVTLAQLERFLRHPVKFFINSRLQVYLTETEPDEDEEIFTLDGLQGFSLKQRLVEEQLQGRSPSGRQFSAEGLLPHGAFAELVFETQSEEVTPLIGQLQDFRGRRPEQIALDLVFDAGTGVRRLTGQVEAVYPGIGLLRWKPGALKGGDILGLWIAHLAWCASGGPGEKHSYFYGMRERFVIRQTLAPDTARLALEGYLHHYWTGIHQPCLLLPRSSYAFALKRNQGGRADPMKAARSQWDGNSYMSIPGDRDDAYIQLVMRGVTGEPLESELFPVLAGAFYDQILRIGQLL